MHRGSEKTVDVVEVRGGGGVEEERNGAAGRKRVSEMVWK
jgi:hypothetical protein